MKKQLGLIILLSLLTVFSNKLSATHIVGGEMTYRHINADDYEIEVRMYRDCYNGIPLLLNPILALVYDQSNSLIDSVYLFRGNMIRINKPDIYEFACHYKLPSICYEYGLFKGTINLPPLPGGYTIVYEECCVNQSIKNNVPSGSFTMSTHLSDSALFYQNDSPVFDSLAPDVVCRGAPFIFDHSASDANGDSLAYELFTPFRGFKPPFTPIPYEPGYSLSQTTRSANELRIDPVTGILTATIDSLGQYIYGVKVSEYRRGSYLGSTWKTYQINAAVCDTLRVTADFNVKQDSCTDELLVTFTGQTSNVDDFYWDFGDTFNSSKSQPQHAYRDTGSYLVTLIGRSQQPGCEDTISKMIYVDTLLEDDLVEANFETIDKSCFRELNFSSTSKNGFEFYWNFNDLSAIDSNENTQHTFLAPGEYDVKLSIVSEINKCQDSITKRISILEKLAFEPYFDEYVCSYKTDFIANLTKGNSDHYDLMWSFGDGEFSNMTNPTHRYQDTGWYNVSLYSTAKDNFVGCNDSAFLRYYVIPLVYPTIETAQSQDTLFYQDDSILLSAFPEDYLSYVWTPNRDIDNQRSPSAKVRPKKSGSYIVAVTNELGCVTRDTLFIFVNPVRCGEDEVYIPNSFTPNDDGQNDFFRIRGIDIESVYMAIYNRWGQLIYESNDRDMVDDERLGWDGTFNGEQLSSGVFVYYTKIVCFEGYQIERKGNVTLIR